MANARPTPIVEVLMSKDEDFKEISDETVDAEAAPSESLPEPPEEALPKKIKVNNVPFMKKVKSWATCNKELSLLLAGFVLLLVLMAIPFTRYVIAGTVIKKDVTVTVRDSKTGGVVSSARVSIAGRSAETDGQGIAVVNKVPVGKKLVSVTKDYYKDASASATIGLSGDTQLTIKTEATGRQTKLKISNSISGEVLSEVEVVSGGSLGKTDKKGEVTIVVPTGQSSKKVTLSLDGYNDKEVVVKASDDKVVLNEFSITPTGKMYFLSKLSGKIDLVKTNLDGTSRATIFAGTGREDDLGTVLLASRNWKYLALLSRHDSDLPKLYLVETANDKVTVMDEGNAGFTLVGWDGNSFIYKATRNAYSEWQSKKHVIKSFDAESKTITALDQTDASGNSGAYIQESFGDIYSLADGSIVYTKVWYNYPYGSSAQLDGKTNGIYSIRADGSGKRTLKTMDAKTGGYITASPSKPNEMYFYYYNSGDATANYLEYSNGALEDSTEKDFPDGGVYNTYLLSPDSKHNFWSESRDGKNTLLVGDSNGDNGKTIATLSDYQTYGWYTNGYLLVSKNSSELYVLPAGGLGEGKSPLKITDYHKPAQSYFGYGGGYGGI